MRRTVTPVPAMQGRPLRISGDLSIRVPISTTLGIPRSIHPLLCYKSLVTAWRRHFCLRGRDSSRSSSFARPLCAGMSAGAADCESAPRLLRCTL